MKVEVMPPNGEESISMSEIRRGDVGILVSVPEDCPWKVGDVIVGGQDEVVNLSRPGWNQKYQYYYYRPLRDGETVTIRK